MKLEWNLTHLFANEEDFFSMVEEIQERLDTFLEHTKEVTKDKFLAVLEEYFDVKEMTNRVLVYGSLRYYDNVKDAQSIELKSVGEGLQNEVNQKLTQIERAILGLGKDTVFFWLRENSKLEKYCHFLDDLFRKQQYIPDEKTSLEIQEYTDEWNQAKNRYHSILEEMDYGEILVDGEMIKLTSSNFPKYLASRNRTVRQDTYFTVNQKFLEKEGEITSVFDTVFYDKLCLAKGKGYSSVLESSLFEENIDPRIIDTLIHVVHKSLPMMQKYLKLKASFLKITDPHLYDFGVPLDFGIKKKYTIDEAISIVKEALKPLGDEYLEVVDILLDGHIDALLRSEKHQSIIFSWNGYSFLNFHGAYGDLKNLIHEIGHSVNDYLSCKNVPFMYMVSTVFVGETSSIVNEILLNRYLYEQATTKEEKIFYLSKEIENYFTSVFKQTMYTEFERELYRLREQDHFHGEELSNTFLKFIKMYYGEDICYDDVSSTEWTRLGHLVRWSYYSYTYATGLLMASVVVHSLVDERTLTKEDYIKFLSSGSSMYSLPLLETIGVDMTDSTVMEQGFKILENDIEELEKLINY